MGEEESKASRKMINDVIPGDTLVLCKDYMRNSTSQHVFVIAVHKRGSRLYVTTLCVPNGTLSHTELNTHSGFSSSAYSVVSCKAKASNDKIDP